jgi:hypothetical protein
MDSWTPANLTNETVQGAVDRQLEQFPDLEVIVSGYIDHVQEITEFNRKVSYYNGAKGKMEKLLDLIVEERIQSNNPYLGPFNEASLTAKRAELETQGEDTTRYIYRPVSIFLNKRIQVTSDNLSEAIEDIENFYDNVLSRKIILSKDLGSMLTNYVETGYSEPESISSTDSESISSTDSDSDEEPKLIVLPHDIQLMMIDILLGNNDISNIVTRLNEYITNADQEILSLQQRIEEHKTTLESSIEGGATAIENKVSTLQKSVSYITQLTIIKEHCGDRSGVRIGDYSFGIAAKEGDKNEDQFHVLAFSIDDNGIITTIPTYMSKSEGGTMRMCASPPHKGFTYITASYVHNDLQTYYHNIEDEIPVVWVVSRVTRCSSEQISTNHDRTRKYTDDPILNPLVACNVAECFGKSLDWTRPLFTGEYGEEIKSIAEKIEATIDENFDSIDKNIKSIIMFLQTYSVYMKKYFRFIEKDTEPRSRYKYTYTFSNLTFYHEIFEHVLRNRINGQEHTAIISRYTMYRGNDPKPYYKGYFLLNLIPENSTANRYGSYTKVFDIGVYVYKFLEYSQQVPGSISTNERDIMEYVFIADFYRNVWPLRQLAKGDPNHENLTIVPEWHERELTEEELNDIVFSDPESSWAVSVKYRKVYNALKPIYEQILNSTPTVNGVGTGTDGNGEVNIDRTADAQVGGMAQLYYTNKYRYMALRKPAY